MTDEMALLRKVKALLAKADPSNNSNAEEAALFAAKAQELMVLYNLDLSKSSDKQRRGKVRFAGGLYKWQRGLWESITRLHFCMYWSERGTAKGSKWEHEVLGQEHNVASVRVLAEYLEGAINRFVRDSFGSDPRHYFSAAANAYREGMVDTLKWRLYLKREEMKAKEKEARDARGSGDTTNALTITIGDLEQEEVWANCDALWGYEPGTTKASALRSRAAYLARAQAEKEADELLKASDPEGWAAKEAAHKAEMDAANAKWRARKPRKEKPKPDAYHDGVLDGQRISLDLQVDERRQALLK